MEQTLAIIKPDAVKKGVSGEIIKRIEEEGFEIVSMRKERIDERSARGFYRVHKDKSFFEDLIEFMTSGPSILLVLEKENAIEDWRELMGPTDSGEAPPDTIRGMYGTDIEKNATHGSDARETAQFELNWFFRGDRLANSL